MRATNNMSNKCDGAVQCNSIDCVFTDLRPACAPLPPHTPHPMHHRRDPPPGGCQLVVYLTFDATTVLHKQPCIAAYAMSSRALCWRSSNLWFLLTGAGLHPRISPTPAPPPHLLGIHRHARTRRQTTASRLRPWLLATSCPGRRSGSKAPAQQRWSRGARPC